MKNLLLSIGLSTLLFSAACSSGQSKAATESTHADSASKGTIHITRAEFLSLVLDIEKNPGKLKYLGNTPCIVDFYATWCGPCKMVSPILEELAKEYAGKIVIYKIDTDKERQLSGEIGIQSIPTFLFGPVGGDVFGSAGTARTPAETKAMFKKIIEEQLLKKQPAL